MIKPTVGRVVWYWPRHEDGALNQWRDASEPLAAIIARVWNDEKVNLAVFDQQGDMHSRQQVRLIHDSFRPENTAFCEWMPYQKGQATKTEHAEAMATTALMAVNANSGR